MRIMVFDLPADSRGAMTILLQYYGEALEKRDIRWTFVVGVADLADAENVEVLKYPWVKKSWFHRLYFDWFLARRIVKKYRPDEILSLQNVVIPGTKVKQTLYLHQPLPFDKKRFSLFEDAKLWMYQNLISREIFHSVRAADTVIVQTEWMKRACIGKTGVDGEKIRVIPPAISPHALRHRYRSASNPYLFFFPAGAYRYKNHACIVDAVTHLSARGATGFRIIFTLRGDETKNIRRLHKAVCERSLPIDFIGPLDSARVYEYYEKSALLFPSYVETFGLPLLEAAACGCPVIASDCEFAHEILDRGGNALFFDPQNAEALAEKVAQVLAEIR